MVATTDKGERYTRLVRLEARAFEATRTMQSRQFDAMGRGETDRADSYRARLATLTARSWRIWDAVDVAV